ncbi:MAG: carboxypeptidase-like regulatory domain-containing protein, partial [Paludibacter sp.]|nr:carboxypeptidase-like regulatory domain-containing protein [Paludibacter sp.]
MRILIILIVAFNSILVLAQKNTDANIYGDVKVTKTGEHIPFINVTVNNTVIGTSTDNTGHYYLKNLPVGKLTIKVSGVGYKTVEKDVVLSAGKTIELNFLTDESAMSLDEVVVSA